MPAQDTAVGLLGTRIVLNCPSKIVKTHVCSRETVINAAKEVFDLRIGRLDCKQQVPGFLEACQSSMVIAETRRRGEATLHFPNPYEGLCKLQRQTAIVLALARERV